MSQAENLARQFHAAYERLAPSFGYETREETRQFDPESNNGRLMIAVMGEFIAGAAGYSKSYEELEAENARLRGELSESARLINVSGPLTNRIKLLLNERAVAINQATDIAARIQRAEEALQWYADPELYDYDVDCCFIGPEECGGGVLVDQGDKARAALISPAPDTGQSGSEEVASVQVSAVEREWDNAADDAAWKDL